MEGRDVQLRASGDAFSVKNKEEGEVTSSSDDDVISHRQTLIYLFMCIYAMYLMCI